MASEDKLKALDMALAQIDKQYGKGTVMKLGDKTISDIESISTGSISLDMALGIGGVPKGRIIEVYGPESSGKTTLALHMVAEVQKNGGIAGFVDGDVKSIEKVYFLTNLDNNNVHFTMSPKEQFVAVKDARSLGLTMLGNFHSHPETPSRPSEEDKRLAYDSTAVYMIMSLMDNDNPVFKAFGVDKDKNVTEHVLEIV